MRLVQSLDRGLEILDVLSKSGDAVTVTSIAQILDVDKSTAYRLLVTLQERGYVEQDEHRRYRLSYKPIQLGMTELNRMELRTRAKPYLRELATATGEVAHFAKLIHDRVVYIERVESPNPVSVSTGIGADVPVHAAATGKALLAFVPREQMERMIAQNGLKRFTPRTITNVDQLRRHLHEIRQVGYAVDDEELHLGVRCIAAPVFDYQGTVVASIGISGPSHRVTLDQLDRLTALVTDASRRLSSAGGFQLPEDGAGVPELEAEAHAVTT
jgi:IclR family acetate operon transcriptional repressor